MKLFLKKLGIFLAISSIIYIVFSLLVLPQLLKATNGPNVQEQLDMSFSNAAKSNCELLILGNSRLYCGINPDAFSHKTYNFSHNNDSYNQLYYKLIWLLNKGITPKYIILGVDYFQFSIFSDSRNYAYGPILGAEYLKDYGKKNYVLQDELVLLQPSTVRNLVKGPNYYQWLKPNGQYVRTGTPKETDFIKRNPERKELQVRYFKRILDVCMQKNIKVFMVMPPMRDIERNEYSEAQKTDFDEFIRSYTNQNVVYLNYSTDSTYKMNDFIDFSHLNQQSATRFSRELNKQILQYINR